MGESVSEVHNHDFTAARENIIWALTIARGERHLVVRADPCSEIDHDELGEVKTHKY